jgi:hypothetical protein
MRTANIVVVRCMKTGRDFGIRFEKSGSDLWTATWAFKMILNQKTKKESQQSGGKLSGRFELHKDFPGCPYCHGTLYVPCSRCGHVYCHDIEKGIRTKCPWCDREATLIEGPAEAEIECENDANKKKK